MKIIQVRDIIRYKTLTIPAPETELEFHQKILIGSKKEQAVAEIVGLARELPGAKVDEEFTFKRLLKESEISEFDALQEGEIERLRDIQSEADKLELDMHFFASKIGWQGKVYAFLFTSDQPVDFRSLLKSVTKKFSGRVHLQRVDVRDRADLIGGPGCCGRPECCGFPFSKQKVTLNAVRDQGIMIKGNEKIYDVSGKLKRCLMYEVDLYKEYRKYLPHLKQEVTIDGKKARVIGLDILNQRVKVNFFDNDVTDIYPVAEVEYPNKQTLKIEPLEISTPEVSLEGNSVPV